MSNDVKEENVIATAVNATSTSQEARELTEHELNTVAQGWCELGYFTGGSGGVKQTHCDSAYRFPHGPGCGARW
jgi:hypothetical protein